MSAASENLAKLNAGYAKIADQLGAEYARFPPDLTSPMLDSKSDGVVQVAITSDPNFSAPLKYNKAVWLIYADTNLLIPFNILIGPYGTFYVADNQPFQPFQGVRCNRVVNIGRGSYSTNSDGTVALNVVNYATAIPIFMQFTREDIQKPASSYGIQLGRAITHWIGFIPAPQGTIQQDDIITDEDGILYMVDAPDYTNMGYVVALRLATV